jgi:hypothetical protein
MHGRSLEQLVSSYEKKNEPVGALLVFRSKQPQRSEGREKPAILWLRVGLFAEIGKRHVPRGCYPATGQLSD